jgi:hypothetical protein
MSELNLNQLTAYFVAIASVISFLLLLLKSLGKEFESFALLWIRVFRRINAERNKPLHQPPASLEIKSIDLSRLPNRKSAE